MSTPGVLRLVLPVALLPLAGMAPAAAQAEVVVPLVRENDLIPSSDFVRSIREHSVTELGSWIAHIDTVSGDLIARDGVILLEEGDALPVGGIDTIDDLHVASDGQFVTSLLLNGGDQVLHYGDTAGVTLVRRSDPVVGATIPAGSVILGWGGATDFSNAGLLFQATIGFGGGGGGVGFGLLRREPGVGAVNEVIFVEGDSVPGLPGPVGLVTEVAIGEDGTWLAAVEYSFLGTTRTALLKDGVPLLLQGDPGPVPGTTWGSFNDVPISVESADSYSVYGRLDLGGGSLASVVYGPSGVVALSGDVIGPFGVTLAGGFGSGEVDALADGRVVHSFPTSGGAVICSDGASILREGDTIADGSVITDLLPVTRRRIAASPSGGFMTAVVELDGTEEALVRINRLPLLAGACTTVPNSTGVNGKVFGVGSGLASANDLAVYAFDLPLNTFGFLITSTDPGFAANPGGSAGNICLGGAIGRYVDQIGNSGERGAILTEIDLAAMPQPTGSISAVAGQNWGFQLWHRDAGAGGAPTSNFTDARYVPLR